ncbi:MAG: NAD(P)/FAD-dependent oxidoreductase [Acidobacteria bacterium]|nr:NAD(P)/FAD-dependent oxidoreductase [Acidobacteriota bacterium]
MPVAPDRSSRSRKKTPPSPRGKLRALTVELSQSCDVAVVGAGAAGLATAIFLRRSTRTRSVLLLDSAKTPGAKILISGGSRCNVTNVTVSDRDFWGGRSSRRHRRSIRFCSRGRIPCVARAPACRKTSSWSCASTAPSRFD